MTFHVYAICWNEERLLPAFLRHYREADRIVIYDNESTDRSRDIILAAGREVISFSTNGTLNDTVNQSIKNSCWKESKGLADWVVVQDLDEFLHFPNHPESISAGLSELNRLGYTASQSTAYNMFCSDEKWSSIKQDQSILPQLTTGNRITWFNYDKVLAFSPNAIEESNFHPGSHYWSPLGDVHLAPVEHRPLMLHFKSTGEEYELNRRIAMRDRLSEENIQKGQGAQYIKTDIEHKAELASLYSDTSITDLRNILFSKPWVLSNPFTETSYLVKTYGDTDFISKCLADSQVWEPKTTALIGSVCHPDMNTGFLDVGANLGVHSLTALASGATKSVSIECHPTTAQLLTENLAANGWSSDRATVIHAAVSDVSGNSLHFRPQTDNLGGSRIVAANELPLPTDLIVQTISLDSIALPFNDCNNIIVKLDVEGHEPEAIAGMKTVLQNPKVKCLLVELNPFTRSTVDIIKMMSDLAELGFSDIRCALIHPPESWAGQSLPKMEPFVADELWEWVRANYIPLDLNIIAVSMQQRRVIEVVILRIG